MKNYELTLRLPYGSKAMDLVCEAADRLPMPASVKRDGSEIHVSATASAYDLEGAYRYLWKELAIRLATRKCAEPDAPDEWQDLLSEHAMKMRGIIEQFADMWPQAERIVARYGLPQDELRHYPTLLSLQALCVTACEFLEDLTGESWKAPPPELVDQLNLSEGGDS